MFAVNFDKLSLTTGSHKVEKENQLLQVSWASMLEKLVTTSLLSIKHKQEDIAKEN